MNERPIDIARKIREELRSIKEYLGLLRLDFQKHTEAISKSDQGANAKQSPPPEVTVLNHLPERIEIHQNAQDTRYEIAYRRAMYFVTSLTLGAITVYAVLVFYQYREMIKATGTAQQAVEETRLNRIQADKQFAATVDQFHLDQRAWVSVMGIEGLPEHDKEWFVAARARNTGKTFAKSFHMVIVGDPMPKGKRPDFANKEAQFSKELATTGILAPNGDYLASIDAEIVGTKIGQKEIDALTKGDITEFVYGRLWYDDVFGCPHWTTYCFKLGTDLKWAGCKEHNVADDNVCKTK